MRMADDSLLIARQVAVTTFAEPHPRRRDGSYGRRHERGVRPDALAPAAGRFRGVADDLGRALVDLRGALGALGDVAGGDEQGRAFDAGYRPRADEGLHALDTLARVLAGVPEGLDRAAAGYRASDGAVGQGLGGQGLGGPP
jgi:hypothetical protein